MRFEDGLIILMEPITIPISDLIFKVLFKEQFVGLLQPAVCRLSKLTDYLNLKATFWTGLT